MFFRFLSTYLCLLMSLAANAQSAAAQVLEDVTEVDVVSSTSVTTHHRRVVMVNNAKGLDAATFYCSCNPATNLAKFSGEIQSVSKTPIKKLKKSDLKQTEYSPHLATDSYYFFYSPTLPTFPAIVTYEWTVHQSDAVLNFDVFMPQQGLDVGVSQASYSVTCAEDVKINSSLYNIDEPLDVVTDGNGKKTIRLTMKDVAPIRGEKLSPSLSERLPKAYFAPDSFTFKGTKGSLSSWLEYGKWNGALLDGRDVLSEDIKQKVHSLTDGLSTPLEKVEALYHYLAETTRYVSIQLGIGGMQPETAERVGKMGFGDCKGLSNYLHAMLKEVGIPSTYAVIGTRHKSLPDDFANLALLNHAILQVELPDTTLWLECTNPQLPMGYVHQDIAGHDAILIAEQGGQKVQLPHYAAAQNQKKKTVVVNLNADGAASIVMEEYDGYAMYEDAMSLLTMKEDKQKEAARGTLSLPDVSFQSFKVEQAMGERGMPLPAMTTSYACTCDKYASVSGKRMLIKLNPFVRMSKTKSNAARRALVQVSDVPQSWEWDIDLSIPDGYEVESLPELLQLSEPWCTFHVTMHQEGNRIRTQISMTMDSAIFQPEQYPQIEDALNRVAEWMNGIIVIVKK